MIDSHRVLAVIPARQGSKGIPDKNIRPLDGVPLLGIAIQHAFKSTLVDQVVLSTDAEKYASIGRVHGADVPFLRPPELSTDSSNPVDAVLHLIEHIGQSYADSDLIVLIEPTSPLRELDLIDRSLDKLVANPRLSGLVSVSRVNTTHPEYLYTTGEHGELVKLFEADRPAESGTEYLRRQDLTDVFFLDGNIYVSRLGALREDRSFIGPQTGYILSKEGTSLEIDTVVDLICAEAIMLAMKNGTLS